MRFQSLLWFSSFFLLAAGCSESTASPASGENGILRFELHSSECIFDGDCSPRDPIARGAHVVIEVYGDDPRAPFRGRITDETLQLERDEEVCICTERSGSGSTSATIDSEDKCYDGAKSCGRSLTLRALRGGSAMLEMVGDDGRVIDRLKTSVLEAARLHPRFKWVRPGGGSVREIEPKADGVLEVEGPVRIRPGARAVAHDGTILRSSAGDFVFRNAELNLPDRAAAEPPPGRWTIEVEGVGLSTEFVLHVLPEGE